MAQVWVEHTRGAKDISITFPSVIPVVVPDPVTGRMVEKLGHREIQTTTGRFIADERDVPAIVIVGCNTNEERAEALKRSRGPTFVVVGVVTSESDPKNESLGTITEKGQS